MKIAEEIESGKIKELEKENCMLKYRMNRLEDVLIRHLKIFSETLDVNEQMAREINRQWLIIAAMTFSWAVYGFLLIMGW